MYHTSSSASPYRYKYVLLGAHLYRIVLFRLLKRVITEATSDIFCDIRLQLGISFYAPPTYEQVGHRGWT